MAFRLSISRPLSPVSTVWSNTGNRHRREAARIDWKGKRYSTVANKVRYCALFHFSAVLRPCVPPSLACRRSHIVRRYQQIDALSPQKTLEDRRHVCAACGPSPPDVGRLQGHANYLYSISTLWRADRRRDPAPVHRLAHPGRGRVPSHAFLHPVTRSPGHSGWHTPITHRRPRSSINSMGTPAGVNHSAPVRFTRTGVLTFSKAPKSPGERDAR